MSAQPLTPEEEQRIRSHFLPMQALRLLATLDKEREARDKTTDKLHAAELCLQDTQEQLSTERTARETAEQKRKELTVCRVGLKQENDSLKQQLEELTAMNEHNISRIRNMIFRQEKGGDVK